MLLVLVLAFSTQITVADEPAAPVPPPLPDYLMLAMQDAQGRALLEKAVGKLALKNVDDLALFVTACKPEQLKSKTEHGKAFTFWQTSTLFATEDDLRSGKAPEEYFHDRIEEEKKISKSHASRVFEIRADYVQVRHWVNPGLCLRNGIDMLDQYEAFIHELTHLIEADQPAVEDPLAFKDLEDYATKTILAPGGEVDAFIAGTSARLRIAHALDQISPPLQPFFDEQGNFKGDRDGFARAILDARPEGGMGYLDRHFRNRYRERLLKSYEVELQYRNGLAKLAEVRLANGNRAAFDRLDKDLQVRDERLRQLLERINRKPIELPTPPQQPSPTVF